MAFGYSVWDASGALQVTSEGTQLPKIIGSTYISGSANSGSVSVPGFVDGEPWVALQFQLGPPYLPPVVTISGTTLSWSFGGDSWPNVGYIWYGIY